MADHLHKQIRDKVKTALTGLTTTATRVWANRLQPLQDANLPGLRIYADDERAEALTVTSAIYQRELTIVVEACAKATSGLDDTLDLISKEVETALAAGLSFSGRVLPVFYTGMSFEDEQLDKPVGIKRMTFTVSFQAAAGTPDAFA